jgi:hypothetical protein
MSVTVLDPALGKLLDELPAGDPDKEPVPMAEVWCPWTSNRHIVLVGEATRLKFGPWAGPRMQLTGISVFARRLDTGKEGVAHLNQAGWPNPHQIITAGSFFTVTIRVVL